MLHHIQPNRKKSKGGGLTKEEKPLVKGLLNMGYSSQDIVHIVNQGRPATINLARVTEVNQSKTLQAASEKQIRHFLKVQSAYDPQTLLNPYKDERLIRAREAMISAVQIFNSPAIIFKTEIFCVLSNIAWTYLLHEKIERTEKGSSKLPNGNSITLSGTLDKEVCPITDDAVTENLKKIIEIRDEVEHTFFVGGEECFGQLFQSCCINFEKYMTDWFGAHLTLTHELSLALQFVRVQKPQFVELEKSDLPEKIKAIYTSIQSSEFKDNNAFQATVYYGLESTAKTNAEIHKLIKYDDDLNDSSQHYVMKPYKPKKLTESQLVEKIKAKGFPYFSKHQHQLFWKSKWENATKRNQEAHKFGELVVNNQWLWYEDKWFPEVLEYCEGSNNKFKTDMKAVKD